MRETWTLVALTSASRIYWVLASLVTTVITARYLGPEGRGVYVAAVAWVTLFATFGHLSLAQVVVFLAAGKPKETWLPQVVGSVLSVVSVLTLTGWVIAVVLYTATGGRAFQNLDGWTLTLSFLALPLLLWLENGNSLLLVLGRLKVMNVAQMTGATAGLALAFLAVAILRAGVPGALVASVLAHLVTIAIALLVVVRVAGAVSVDRGVVRQLLSGGAKLHLNAIGTYLFAHANILILNHYRSPEETAYFQLAAQLFTGVQIIPSAVSSVVYTIVAREGPNEAWPHQRKLLLSVLALMAVAAGVGYFLARFAVPLVFGERFGPAVPLFRILLLGVIGLTMSLVMASQWIARGLFLQAALLTLAIGCVTVVANYLVVPDYGAVGAAWVMVGTYSLSIVGNGGMLIWVEARYREHRRGH